MNLYPYLVDDLTFSLDWRTSVYATFRDEKRESLRPDPHLTFEVTSEVIGPELQHALSIFQQSGGSFLMPDWRIAKMGRVTGNVFPWKQINHYLSVGDLVVTFWGEAVEMTTVTAIDANTVTLADVPPAAVFVAAPVLPMKLTSDPKVSYSTGVQAKLSFQCTCEDYPGFAPAAMKTFGGYPALSQRAPVSAGELGIETGFSFDVGSAGVVNLSPERLRPLMRRTYGFNVDNASDYVMRERELFAFSGRSNPFWATTWGDDFDLRAPAVAGADTLEVRPRKTVIADLLTAIAITDAMNEPIYYPVDAVTATASGLVVKLQYPLQGNLVKTSRITISRANLMRLDTDEVTCSMEGHAYKCSASTVEVFI